MSWSALALAGVLVAAGSGAVAIDLRAHPRGPAAPAPARSGVHPQHDRRVPPAPARTSAAGHSVPALPVVADPGRPARLVLPAIGVRTALQPLHRLADGTLQPPSHWDEAGWYAGGVRPGALGPAVIAGHVDSVAGPAVFYRLRQLRPGSRAVVTLTGGRRLVFVVDSVRSYPKRSFPTVAVYGATPDAELRLVTCTGTFDSAAGSYLDNLVVSAHLISHLPAARGR